MNDLCHIVLQSLEAGVSVVLATVMDSEGSAPRAAGARMLVLPDGFILGSVGGGRYEAEVIDAAREMHGAALSDSPYGARPGTVLEFSLRGVTDMDMVCGGALQILLEFLPHGDTDLRAAFALGRDAEKQGRPWGFVTGIEPAEQGRSITGRGHRTHAGTPVVVNRRVAFPEGGRVHCTPGREELREDMAKAFLSAGNIPRHVRDAGREWLLEFFPRPFRAFVFGGGHVGRETAKLALEVGFRVAVVEDRPEFADAGRFPGAEGILLSSLREDACAAFLAARDIGSRDALVILTRGHAFDRDVLAASLGTRAGYIGMIGSKSKRAAVYASLVEAGAPPGHLEAVHSPIGLPIGAQTPVEIAVSIVAELINWRAELRRHEG